jgi:hypothetical protein
MRGRRREGCRILHHPVRVSRFLFAVASVAFAAAALLLAGEAALAQPGSHTRSRGKPKPAADAGSADNPYADDVPAYPVASSAARGSDAGSPPAPIAHIDLGDGGGINPSPLNPVAAEFPPQTPPPPPDYDALLADVSALRARVAVVTDTLFQSRILITLEASGSHAKIGKLAVSLDDGVVYSAPPSASFRDEARLYEHGVSPGRHAVVVDVDRKDDRDDTFRTSQRSRFVVDVPKDQELTFALYLDDDSTMGADFSSDHAGHYDLRVRAKATAKSVR